MSYLSGFLGLILGLSNLGGCGSNTTMNLSFTATTEAPDLIVIISLSSDGSFSENLDLGIEGDGGELLTFYGNSTQQAHLKGCAVERGWVTSDNFDSPPGEENTCDALRAYYRDEIFQGQALTAGTDDNGDPIPLQDPVGGTLTIPTDSTHVFAVFFYGASDADATNRCFQLFSARVRNKKLNFDSSGTTQNTTAAELTLADPGAAPNDCFVYD